jgi:hypothetical protein
LVAQHRRDIWTCQELLKGCNSPWEVIPHPHDNFQVILEDSHPPHVSGRDIRGAQERFAGVECRVKLAGRHLQLEAFWYGEVLDVGLLKETLAEVKRLEIREP